MLKQPKYFVVVGSIALSIVALLFPTPSFMYFNGGVWNEFTYNGPAGSRPYFVYTPAGYQPGRAVPLIVMLHGCLQTPAEFATGTQMDQLADQKQFIAVYPQQTSTYNQEECWNWSDPADQSRGSGEPAMIAGITQRVERTTSRWTIDSRRVYIAGLSAGAAMSVIVGATYPDLFSAIGVHTGLEYKAASTALDAVTVMRMGGNNPTQQGQIAYLAMGSRARVVPTIVFQGTRDPTISPINGDQVIQQWMQTNHLASSNSYNASFQSPSSTTIGQITGGYSYTVLKWNNTASQEVQEYWMVEGMGHAWSGGSPFGSFTDPRGPGASLAMYNFFMSH